MPKKYNNVVALKNGKFRARLTFKRDESGVRPPAKDFYGDSAATADKARATYLESHGKKPLSVDGNIAFGQFLTTKFLPHEEALHHAGEQCWSNYDARRSRITNLVIEHDAGAYLRQVKMNKMRPEHVETFFEALLVAQIKPRRYNDLRVDLKRALKYGRRRLSHSLDEFFENIDRRKTPKPTKRLFNAADIMAAITDESKPLMARLWVAFLFVLNCRMNETWALRWTDIRNGWVFFERTVQDAPKGSTVTDGTKTQSLDARREEGVPLGAYLAGLLARWHDVAPSSEYVFCREDGSPFDRHLFKAEWKEIVRVLGLPEGPTPYGLKTLGLTYKSKVLGLPDAVLARFAGHTTEKLVKTAYRYVDTQELSQAVQSIPLTPIPSGSPSFEG